MSPRRRRFSRRSPGRLRNALPIVAAALLAVAACAPESAHWSPRQAHRHNDVRWITFEHTARFLPGADDLSDEESRRLTAFLARHEAGYGDQMLIGAVGDISRPEAARAAGRREAAVAALLRRNELGARLLPRTPGAERWNGTVRIVLGRFIVIPPECPDWSKRADADPANEESSNLGCATATNLGLMVANPQDLVRGRAPGPADGATGARRYRSYREGEQTQAPAITPLIIQSGVGAGGGQ